MIKNILIGIVIALLGGVLIETVFNLDWMSVVVGLLLGLITTIVLIARSRGEQPEHIVREVVKTASDVITITPTRPSEQVAQEKLFSGCLQFITSGAASEETVKALQMLVGELRGILPRALNFAPGSETTFTVMKLAREDLPSLLLGYVELPPAEQQAKAASLNEQLRAVTKKIRDLASIIDQSKVNEYDAHASFINLKFN